MTKHLILILILILTTGGLSSLFVQEGLSAWYLAYPSKPAITPPSVIFSLAWIIIYTLLTISTFIVIKKTDKKLPIYSIFSYQLALQILWCWAFFKMQSILAGLIIILSLDLAVFIQAKMYHKISKTACYTLIPYYLWITFATILNICFLV